MRLDIENTARIATNSGFDACIICNTRSEKGRLKIHINKQVLAKSQDRACLNVRLASERTFEGICNYLERKNFITNEGFDEVSCDWFGRVYRGECKICSRWMGAVANGNVVSLRHIRHQCDRVFYFGVIRHIGVKIHMERLLEVVDRHWLRRGLHNFLNIRI